MKAFIHKINPHTPGPWIFDPATGSQRFRSGGYVDGNGDYKIPIASIAWTEDETCVANAKLISAAPELLSALKELVQNWDGEDEDMYHARAAIDKATKPI